MGYFKLVVYCLGVSLNKGYFGGMTGSKKSFSTVIPKEGFSICRLWFLNLRKEKVSDFMRNNLYTVYSVLSGWAVIIFHVSTIKINKQLIKSIKGSVSGKNMSNGGGLPPSV